MSCAVDIHRSVVCCKAGRVHLVQEKKAERKHPVSPEDGVIGAAATVLMLASYRNQCMHVFVRPAILAAAIHTTRATLRGGDYKARLWLSKEGIKLAFLFSQRSCSTTSAFCRTSSPTSSSLSPESHSRLLSHLFPQDGGQKED